MMGPGSPMLHTKPQGHWLFVLEKTIFEGFLLYMGVVAILVMWPWPHNQTFIPPSHWGSIWYLAKRFWRRSLKMVDDWRTDHRPWLYYKLTNEPKGELKIHLKSNFIHFFHDLIHLYSTGAGADNPLGTKFLMSTGTSCHFVHLLQVSKNSLYSLIF